jgi:hypothetical protein
MMAMPGRILTKRLTTEIPRDIAQWSPPVALRYEVAGSAYRSVRNR